MEHSRAQKHQPMICGWVDFSEVSNPSAPTISGGLPLAATDLAGRRALCVPGLEILTDDRSVNWAQRDSLIIVASGTPRFIDPGAQAAQLQEGIAAGWAVLYRDHGERAPTRVKDAYSVVILDLAVKKVLLATDRFSIHPLCYSVEGEWLAFSDRADTVPCRRGRVLDLQALYDYLYFHVIPAPRTAFQGAQRLLGGHSLVFHDRGLTTPPHWTPRFQENERIPFEELASEFRTLVRDAVRREADGSKVGCFLSGGTDSSTVAGMLRAATGKRPKTFSIGFDADGYDEMSYARLAARHFDTEHHEYYLTPDDLVQGITKVATHYDQPFGNSSALAAYHCALLAKGDGLDKLLAGDGGDELFGGNARYARQKLFAAYEGVPSNIRRAIVEPVLLKTPGIGSVPLVRKAASYVRQALTPMPARMNTYNLLQRLGVEAVLTAEFLHAVDPLEPEEQERRTYGACRAASLINRMLAYDWKYTLSDNDLPKVTGTAALAGISVGYPLLSDELVDFSLKLRPELKVKGLKLRYFFKEALRGFLPDEIINKTKHGFGLPFGVWLTRSPKLLSLACDSLSDLGRRSIVRREFVNELLDHRLSEHPAYYGEMVWILMMLEQWLTARTETENMATLARRHR
jgi:asparagine synthase (glutamine-hydrolysing)